jgi:hypothetical protein
LDLREIKKEENGEKCKTVYCAFIPQVKKIKDHHQSGHAAWMRETTNACIA